MKYMLDTDMIVYIRNSRPEAVLKKFEQYDPQDICISAITLAELEYGVFNSSDPLRNRLGLWKFLSQIQVLPFDGKAAMEYGEIRSELKRKGQLIGANDLLIAAHARASELILVTNNVREFGRVRGLKLENWTI